MSATLRERLPVVVSFSPDPADAAYRRIRVFPVTADCPISSGEKSGASVITLVPEDGGFRSAIEPFQAL